ncbi:tRNA (guanine-N(1)-)-methyltransferase [Thraustotheca clavata]|uniref:tRNA (guanine(9)-N(1))-methyltransferase n=1 Tax=Thraustotheca clavata TaxID=74557 RepID=A0A1V9YTY2_9STRA|nr:tRNA (guanine-N(1)-)-methyltransferase [Thraustotheca clavata]
MAEIESTKDLLFEEKREWKNAQIKQRKKERRRELLCSMNADERKAYLLDEALVPEEQKKRLEKAKENGQRIVVDCGYDEIMNDKEINSLSKQIKYSYGSIKRMDQPFAFTIANYHGRIQDALERFGCSNWTANMSPNQVDEIFNTEELVFLSPDSLTVLETLEPTKVYVIGGIVDRSRVKGRTRAAADAIGVATARLPIQEYIVDRHNDHILNVNTVVDILASIHGGATWPEALEACLPKVL